MGPVVDGAADGSSAYGGCADAPTHIGSAVIDTTIGMMVAACMVDAASAATATATASR